MLTKPRRTQDKDYLAYIRRQPCAVCMTDQGVQPHHLDTGGMGTKCSDYLTAPLCARCHRELHDTGQKAFQQAKGVNLYRQGFKLYLAYQDA